MSNIFMRPIILILITAITLPCLSYAQYTQQGKIIYERKTNAHAQLDDHRDDASDDEWIARRKAQTPKFTIALFDLFFTPGAAIYKPDGTPEEDQSSFFSSSPAATNIVFTDFKSHQVTADKAIFEKKFLVKDTMRVIEWKIMGEIRTIQDYKCRKAVGKICDSVYVIAFYTDDIMVSGGPEMFSGLPGMIMELAIPRLHTTWTATKVEFTVPKPDDLMPPTKGKITTEKQLYETLKNTFSDWGKLAGRNMWWCVL